MNHYSDWPQLSIHSAALKGTVRHPSAALFLFARKTAISIKPMFTLFQVHWDTMTHSGFRNCVQNNAEGNCIVTVRITQVLLS